MQLRRHAIRQIRGKRLFSLAVILVTLALAACGGSSKSTSTTASSASTSQATTAATSTTSGGAATATTAATATEAATTATQAAINTATTIATEVATATQAASSGGSGSDQATVVMTQVAKAMKDAKSYKMTLTSWDAGSSTPNVTATVETVNPDKSHMVIDTGGQKIETITIGSDSYLNIGGTWTKSPSTDTTELPFGNSADVSNELSTPIPSEDKFSSKGSDTVNGVDCNVYEIVEPDGTDSTFYVGKKDHLLYKIDVTDPDGSKVEIVISDYNGNFDITAPI